MKFNLITHAEFEGPGVIVDWIISYGYNYSIFRPYKGDTLGEDAHEGEMLIIMGGP